MELLKGRWPKIIAALLLIIFVLLVLSRTKISQSFYKSTLIASEITWPVKYFHFLNRLTKEPETTTVGFNSSGHKIIADLYLPKDSFSSKKHPAALLLLGVDIGRKDERNIKLANVLARLGYVAMVPDIPHLIQRRVTSEAVDDLVSSYQYLEGLGEVDPEKIGFVSFCASGGLSLIASEDSKIAAKTSYVLAVNPYFDILSLYSPIVLKEIEGKSWQPHFKTVEVYNREIIEILPQEVDKNILNKYLVDISQQELESAKFTSPSGVEWQTLSPQAKLIFQLLTNKNKNAKGELIQKVLEFGKERKNVLSPSTNVANLGAKLFIIADKNNIYLPYSEADSLFEATKTKNPTFLATNLFPTGEIKTNLPIWQQVLEGMKIFFFMAKFFVSSA